MTTPLMGCMALLLPMIIIALQACEAIPKDHYHRYFLSDYKRQHRNKTQKEYLPLPRPSYPDDGIKIDTRMGKPSEPMVAMIDSDERVELHELLVRIYHGNNYLCMGTLITNQVVLTVGTCFQQSDQAGLTVKTSTNKILELSDQDASVSLIQEEDSAISLLTLKNPLPNFNHTAQLCLSTLEPKTHVDLTTYIRQRREVHTQFSDVLPLDECRQKLSDPKGNVVSTKMICLKNEKKTSGCQLTYGNPLVHEGQICGVNLLGHNCPKMFGVDLYVSVVDEAEYIRTRLSAIMSMKLEESIL